MYPEFIDDIGLSETPRWIDAGLRFRVLDRSDAEGLGRDDPGAIWPERVTAAELIRDAVRESLGLRPFKIRRGVAAVIEPEPAPSTPGATRRPARSTSA